MAVETVGSFTALAVEFEHEGATGDVLLSISTCLPGPSTFFLGEVVKGFEVGNVKLYDLGVTPVTVPATAIDVPSGRSLLAAIDAVLAPAGVLGDFWVSMWVRTTSRPHPYLSLFTSVGGGYIWLGADLQWIDPVPGARNLAYFGPNGGHGLGSEYPPLNTWTHHVWSVSGGTVKGWLDKAPITWDAGPTTDGVLGASTWNPVTHLRLLNETGGGQDFIGGARAIAIGKKTGHLTQGEVDDIYEQNAPGTVAGVVMTGMTMLGSWPLATSSDLTSAVAGGPDLVVEGGALGTDVTGPTAITVL